MSANSDELNTGGFRAKVLATIEQSGNLIEHINCSTESALKHHLEQCNREGRRILPGRPLKLPANPAQRIDYFLELSGAESIIEHSLADQVISVQAGMPVSVLQNLLSENKQWFPVCLADESISLMEYINQGSSGPLEHGYGQARDLILGMQVALSDGTMIKCGGKVVKNVTGYDLPKLFAGSHGTLCIPFSAHLRLFALPETHSTIVFGFNSTESAFRSAGSLRRSGLPLSCLEIVDGGIFQLVESEKTADYFAHFDKDKIFVCVQIHGTEAVVDEVYKALSRIVLSNALSQQKLESSQSGKLWQFLAGPAAFLSAAWLELAGPTRDIAQVLTEMQNKQKAGYLLKASCSLAWTARPGRNKGLLVWKDKEQTSMPLSGNDSSADSMTQIYAQLCGLCAQLSSPITVACADDNYLWKVRRLPEEDPVLNELKHRLKHEYDPHGILNPLALL